jgi:hypothetical protein
LRSVKIGDTDDISSYIQQVMNICGDFEAVYRLPGMLSTLSPVIPGDSRDPHRGDGGGNCCGVYSDDSALMS